jgi:hypothetical protein
LEQPLTREGLMSWSVLIAKILYHTPHLILLYLLARCIW